jgi:hypothetical protein
MKRNCVTFSFLAISLLLTAKDLKYAVADIPSALKENAHTVVRLQTYEVEIKSEKEAVIIITEVRTILNKNGLNDSYFMEGYSPMMKITSLSGRIYDQTGKQVKSLGIDEIQDYSMFDGFSLYQDNRIKRIDPKYLNYPFTVEYNYQMNFKQTLFLPSWVHLPQNTSYEKSSYTLKVPKGYGIRYKEYSLPKSVEKSSTKENDIYSWSLSNLIAGIDEPFSSIDKYEFPYLKIAPNSFVLGDSKGSAETWKELGIWSSNLNKDRDKLPEATVTKLKELTANCKTDFEKVKIVYEFMQQKTRYVNVAIGIGGWQPFDAATVDKTSYGDCKALSNFTKSLLSVVGIKSYYALNKAGSDANSVDRSFPSSQFNHAFVCVPLEKDTVWLECTSQRLPCGYNSDFTDDRDVLLVDGENSRLVHTRIYSAFENCTNRISKVVLTDETAGEATINTQFIGIAAKQMMNLYYADNADKKKYITEKIDLPSFSLKDFSLTENRCSTPSIVEKLNISVNNYIRKIADNQFLLPLSFMNKQTYIPEKIRNRKSEVCIRRAVMENDTIIFQLPTGYKLGELPANQSILSKFGKYHTKATTNGNNITYIRHFELFKGAFPANEYADFREFFEQVSTGDEAVASLKKI